VDAAGRLASLPQLVDGHAPDLDRLPGFVLALARDVDWAEEKPCFRTLAEVRARPRAAPGRGAPSLGTHRGPARGGRSGRPGPASPVLCRCGTLAEIRLGAGRMPSNVLSALMAVEILPPSASQAAQASSALICCTR